MSYDDNNDGNNVSKSTATPSPINSELALSAVFNSENVGIIIKDRNGVIIDWNKGAHNILGYTSDIVVGLNIEEYASGPTQDLIRDITKRLLDGESITQIEQPRLHTDGHLVWCMLSYMPVFDVTGYVTGSIVVFFDITDKKRAEASLLRLNEDTAALINELPAPVCILNESCTTFLDANRAFLALFELSDNHALHGLSVKNAFITDDDADSADLLKSESGSRFHGKKFDGTLFEMSTNTRQIHFNDQPATVVHVVDLTLQQKQERIMREIALAAEEASRMKTHFIANMSHEIRTPMNGIFGFAELALDEPGLTDVVRDYLHKIKLSAEGLLGIINNVLDISKIEAGKADLELIPFDLKDVILQCDAISTPKAVQKGLKLYMYIEDDIDGLLIGDPTKLRQIVLNLLCNAIKFTSTGYVKFFSTVTKQSAEMVRVSFSVKDSGIGMSAKQVENIFQPFTQADQSTTRRFGGTGLGLSIAKSLVNLMGGVLKVESEPNVGSVFSFDLDFQISHAESLAAPAAELSLEAQKKPIFEGTVLVCEDNEINQQVIAEHLKKVGLSYSIAENGKDGVQLACDYMNAGHPFDIILMDVQMPIMDGIDATLEIVRLGIPSPVIAMTANVLGKYKDSFLTAGMVDYIGKPFRARELWSCLMKYLRPVRFVTLMENVNAEPLEPTARGSEVLDRKVGLERCLSNQVLYSKLLSDFTKTKKKAYGELLEAFGENNLTLAKRISHTIKGVCGTIGAATLEKSAEDIEEILTEGMIPSKKYLERFKRDLHNLIDAINEGENTADTEAVVLAGAADSEQAKALADKLEALLRAGSSVCLDLTGEIQQYFAPYTSEYKNLCIFINDYEFDMASEVLRSIRRNFYQ